MNQILLYTHPMLRQVAETVSIDDPDLDQIVSTLSKMVEGKNEIGLAANQIGILKSLAVCDMDVADDMDEEGNRQNPDVKFPFAIINPVITVYSDEKETGKEGCLSFPKMFLQIERSTEIKVEYDVISSGMFGKHKFKHVKNTVRGFLARVLQHEIDHMNGILFIDHIHDSKKFIIKNKLQTIKKRAAKQQKNMKL